MRRMIVRASSWVSAQNRSRAISGSPRAACALVNFRDGNEATAYYTDMRAALANLDKRQLDGARAVEVT
jgi:hypothetical protein